MEQFSTNSITNFEKFSHFHKKRILKKVKLLNTLAGNNDLLAKFEGNKRQLDRFINKANLDLVNPKKRTGVLIRTKKPSDEEVRLKRRLIELEHSKNHEAYQDEVQEIKKRLCEIESTILYRKKSQSQMKGGVVKAKYKTSKTRKPYHVNLTSGE